ncbi:MAG TPA: DUF4038 domain-containing protein [Clostridia bacterium]|nr:DUF4038 domain-containing protein [Clostridia bacterium]
MKQLFKELVFKSESTCKDFFNDVTFDVLFTHPDGSSITIPGFWAGKNIFKARYDISIPGKHKYITISNDDSLNGISGEMDITKEQTENPLYLHGAVCRFGQNMHLSHKDGTPFYWLADTWWMALTKRLTFPKDFMTLLDDRIAKGFNVVQIIAGLYPDMTMFDPRGENEAGFPWKEDLSSINPEYFDKADERIMMLVDKAVMPCIVGSWGFYMSYAGKDTLKKHWRYIIARWGAMPVCWCVAGEANMAFYNDHVSYEEHIRQSRKDWNEMTLHIKKTDPYGRLITIHPFPATDGYDQIKNGDLLDINMLQTDHGGFASLVNQMKKIKKAVDRKVLPVINAEVCYEGICGSSYADTQRYVYLSDFLLGTAGHTYGANGIWQINSEEMPYGASPHGAHWGNTSWKEAMNLDGSKHISHCMKYLTSFEWWNFKYHPEWVEKPCSLDACDGHFSASIPGKIRVIYKPHFGGSFFGEINVLNIEKDVNYKAYRFNPITGKETPLGDVTPDIEGKWKFPRVDAFQDWIYVLKAE